MASRENTTGKQPIRPPFVAVMVFLVAALISTFVVWKLNERAVNDERLRVGALARDNAHVIQITMERALSATYSLAAMVRQGRGKVPDFEGVAREMLTLYPGVAAIGLAPDGIIAQVVPLEGNQASIGFDQLNDPVQGADSRRAMETGQLTVAGPLKLVQGGIGVVGRLPVYLPHEVGRGSFWGFVYVVIRFPNALNGSRLTQLLGNGYGYELWRDDPKTGEHVIISASTFDDLIDPVEQFLELPNGRWTLGVAPVVGWNRWDGITLGGAIGLSFSLILAYMAALLAELKRREKSLESVINQRTAEIRASRNKLQATMDAIPDLMVEVGLDGTCHDAHMPRTMPRNTGVHWEAGKKVSDMLPAAAAAEVMAALQEAHRNGRAESREVALPMPGGTLWYEISVATKTDDTHGAPRFIVLSRNITGRKQTESDLKIAATAFNSLEGIAVTDADRRVLRVNAAFSDITGYSAEEVMGRTLDFLNSDRHDAAFFEALWHSVLSTGSWRGELWNRRKNGEIYPELGTVTAVKGDDGVTTHYVNTFADISQRKASEEEINKLAYYDSLTNLPNRRLLLDRLRQAVAVSARSGAIGALQFLDLDNFKTLNDTLGHDMGDRLLQQVASRLSDCLRQGDTVARLGGDEFVVMLEELGTDAHAAAAQAEVVGEKILAAINHPYHLTGHEYHITCSVGITLFGGQPASTDDLLKQADLAMYQAKGAGRHTLRFFDPAMQSVVSARVALESDIRLALAKDQFILYYQPQINRAGQTVGAEALLRWPHPVRGMVPPNEFISLAEETGLILPLGNWVLETACAQLVVWSKQETLRDLTLAVNVSARQFRQQDFVEYVQDLISYTGANPGRLKLELTESLLVHDVEGTIAKMEALQRQGIRFSLDDFGTGYSSLSYLKRLPLDQLKIDQSFVRDLLTDPNDAAIASTVVALGRSLGLNVIAEGVESEAQRDFLANIGCDSYQGYFFDRPMPVAVFEQRLLATPGPT